MIFKKLNMEYASFDLENLPDLKKMINENCRERRNCGPMADIVEKFGNHGSGNISNRFSADNEDVKKSRKKAHGLRRA